MLKCKNCGENLTKFNKEICPYCGCKNPLSESVAETDTTKAISYVKEEFNINQKSFKSFIFLTCFLGIFGIEYIYLNKIKEFIFTLIANIILYLCIFFITFACTKEIWVLILVPLFFIYFLSLVYALYLTLSKSKIKDKNGVSLK